MQLVNDELIKKWEELRLVAYMPTPNDRPTIGWGHTKGVRMGMKIDQATAQRYFEEDVAWAVNAVNSKVKIPLNQNQFDVLVSFTFNVGEGAFGSSTLLRKLNRGDYEGAARELPRWNKQSGKVLRGLTRRRAEEMEIFLSPVSSSKKAVSSKPAEGPNPLKNIFTSKEVAGGVGAVIGGLKGILDGSTPETVMNPQTMLYGFLVVIGVVLVINRLAARNRGDR